jgi:hypothetical protein
MYIRLPIEATAALEAEIIVLSKTENLSTTNYQSRRSPALSSGRRLLGF